MVSHVCLSLVAVHVSEDPSLGKEPDHLAGISLFALEAKLDYMGSSVLMMRGNSLEMKCKDEWKRELRQDVDKPLATQRYAHSRSLVCLARTQGGHYSLVHLS